jgi:DNA-binding transcriptional LysR family regulator
MELRHLRYFLAVAEELHFGRAAERLFIAQPPLSQQIRQLERELGVQLFVRNSRKVALTGAGQMLVGEARQVLACLDQALQRTQRADRGEDGWLGLGFVASATHDVLPRLLHTFGARYPHVQLGLYEMTSAAQIEALRQGRIDVGLARPAIEDHAFVSETLVAESLLVALPEGHRLAALPAVPLAALADEGFIAYPRYPLPSFTDFLFRLCERAGFSPRVVQETGQMQTALSLIAADLGIALVPAAVQQIRRDGVAFRPLEAAVATTTLTLVHRRQDPSPVLARFIETALTVFQP